MSQKALELAEADATNFVKTIWPFLNDPSHDLRSILNMDQTPVYYLMHEKCTLNKNVHRQ